MATQRAAKLTIKAYEKFENGALNALIGTYEVQLNPSQVSFSLAEDDYSRDAAFSATGGALETRRPAFFREVVGFSFILDQTGAIPNEADGVAAGSAGGAVGLKASIDKLKKTTIQPLRSTHAPPFVLVLWGDISLQGIVTGFSVDFTYFNINGNPLRAVIRMSVTEVVDSVSESAKFQSPDITRMPIIRAGDTLPGLCQDFYDSPLYYIRIAQANKLSSFRRLRPGERLVFPPLEK